MTRTINSVAVIGAGTMGTGIAGKCADAGCRVLLLDVDRDTVDAAMDRITDGRPPAIDNPDSARLIETGTFDDLAKISGYDWICEAVIEDLATKRDMFTKLERWRSDGSVISTNTSGIPLRSITEDMPERLRRDVVVTHFFNPVKVMKLLEIVPGEETEPEVVDAMAAFGSTRLDKGVVHAKDTVNFIGNRIGCYWMLSGLHKARKARREGGLQMEEIDVLMSTPVGLPPTGLYGLIDLIGLDVMDLVARNLAVNLPEGDAGHLYTTFPDEEQAMLARGQFGRKTRGGFYRVARTQDGGRLRETFDLDGARWRPSTAPDIAGIAATPRELMTASGAEGDFARDLMGGVLAYAAGLVGEISDDIVNIDRAMRWGFAWKRGPFELIDDIGHDTLSTILETSGEPLPVMLRVAGEAGASAFHEGGRFLGLDGRWHDPVD